MKSLTAIERAGIVLGIIFVLFGLYSAIWPRQTVVHHSVNDARGRPRKSTPEVVGKDRARFYGIMCVTVGIGITAASAYPLKRR